MKKGKQQARYKLNRAVKSGSLKKPSICSRCPETERIEGHHPDYTKPLEVIWVCWKCHGDIHKNDYRNNGYRWPNAEVAI